MYQAIGFFSFIAFVIFAVVAVFKIFKDRTKAKKYGIYTLASFVVLIVAASLDDSKKSGAKQNVKISSSITKTQDNVLHGEVAKPQPDPKKIFEELLTKELEPLNKKWERIEVREASNTSYVINVKYKESANISGYGEVSNDTKSVVRAALHVLMAKGRNPNKEWIFVRAHAHQAAGFGETGAPLTRVLGKSTYDFNSDQIKFDIPE